MTEDETDTALTEAETDTMTEPETGAETEPETGQEDLVENRVTFVIGDTDSDGNYYVRQEDSPQVHVMNADVLEIYEHSGE